MENDRRKALQDGIVSGENDDSSSGLGTTAHPSSLSFTTLCSMASLPSTSGATAEQLASQTLSVVQDGDSSTAAVTELINPVSLNAGLSVPQVQWSNIGGQNAIITLHTLPLMEGGQGITITDNGVSLDPSLVQTLLSQAVGLKQDELATNAAGVSVTGSGEQLIQFTANASQAGGSATREQLIQFMPSASQAGPSVSQATVVAEVLQDQAGPSQEQAMHAGITLEQTPTEIEVELTDETPIFSRVCATLNTDLVSAVPGVQDVLIEQLAQDEADSFHVGMDDDRQLTVETTLPNLVTIHNRLKQLLKLPVCTKFCARSCPSPPPPPAPPKKMETVGVSCQLLVPFVSSKGRRVKMPSSLQGAVNDLDFLDSDDGEEDFRKYSRRKKTYPRKVVSQPSYFKTVSNVTAPKTNQQAPGDSEEGKREDLSEDQTVQGESESRPADDAGEEDNNEDAENIFSYHPNPGTILRKARNNRHETPATHMRRIYEGRIPYKFFCRKCSFKSKRESHFVKHMKHHELPGTVLHKCTECDFKTIRLSHLRRHELVHKKNLVTCSICGFVTDGNQQLLKHIKLKHPDGKETKSTDQTYKCEICGRCLSSRAIYTQHLLKHAQDSNTAQIAPDGSYQCTDCHKTFQRRVYFERHRRDVHGPQHRPHLCDICGKAFKRTDALQQHKVVHMSQTARVYAFHCSTCNKGFRSQAHLNEHMTMHSSDRPYLCQYCGSAFKTPSVQRKHIMSIHLKPRSYICNMCSKKFNTRSALQRHSRTHELEAQKLAAAQTTAVEGGLTELGIADAEQLQQAEGTTVVTVEDATAAQVLQTQQQTLVQDVIGVEGAMEEALEQGEVLQPQYIQGNETATALFYLTGSLMEPTG